MTELTTDNGIDLFNALRLFAHNVRLADTIFESRLNGQAATLQEIIVFRSSQSWGDLTRTREGLTLKIIPNIGLADDFKARTFIFPRDFFNTSNIMKATPEDFLLEGGKRYTRALAASFDVHQKSMKLQTTQQFGSPMLVLTPADTPHIESKKIAIARFVNDLNRVLAAKDQFTVIRYPMLDVPGHAHVRNQQDKLVDPAPEIASTMEVLNKGLATMSPALVFEPQVGGFPVSFKVLPLGYSFLDPEPKDEPVNLVAAARLLESALSAPDLTAEYNVIIDIDRGSAADPFLKASDLFKRDWNTVMKDEPAPVIMRTTITASSSDPSEEKVVLACAAEPAAAEAYNLNGYYNLVPR